MKKRDIRELLRKKSEAIQKRQTVIDKAAEESRGYTDEERTQVQDLAKEIGDLTEQIRDIEQNNQALEGTETEERGQPNRQQTEPGATQKRFANLAEFVRDIYRSGKGQVSEKLIAHRASLETQMRAMNITDASSLGLLIPDQFEAGTLQLTGTGGHVRQRARVIPAGEFPDQKFVKRVLRQGQMGAYNGILFNWIGEGVAPVDESKLQYDRFTLDPSDKKLAGFYITSEESLQNPTSVTADMEASFRGALGETEDDVFINGDGVGKPRGILSSPGRYEVARKTALKFAFDDVVQMAKHMYPRATNRNWEISLDLYDQVAAMVDGANRYIMIAGDATKGIPDILHGRPIFWSEIQPAAGTAGDVILVDWSFYFIKDGSGPYFATDPYTRFLEGEIRVKMVTKIDGDTWIKAPLKLKNGMSVSPFIVLK
ncbi:MAG TPA: phage major capsid protein [Spirochaetia bacterium]|nr:phage major capsid protein [Spirochaetia bacterium]